MPFRGFDVDNDGVLEPDALPMSSQQEIDDVLEIAVNGPESPKVSQPSLPQAQSQSLQFETHVAYPSLPSQRHEESQQEDEGIFSSQLSAPKVAYPELPEQPSEQTTARQGQVHEEGISSQLAVRSQPEVIDEDDSYVIVDDEPLTDLLKWKQG